MNMILRWNNKDRLCGIILDSGASIPVLKITWVRRNSVPIFERQQPQQIKLFTGKTETDIGNNLYLPDGTPTPKTLLG
jgi:hypothetical protein